MPKRQPSCDGTIIAFEQPEKVDTCFEAYPKEPHRNTFLQLRKEIEALPKSLQSTECLFLAARLVEEGAFATAHDRPREDVVQLLRVAAQIEREVQRISGILKP